MVDKLLRILNRDISSIHHAAYILAFSSLLSQILGLLRDRLLAGSFGAGTELDVYYAAFRVQDFIFYSIASLLSLAVLIPLLTETLEKEGKGRARELLDSLFTLSFMLVSLVSFAAFVGAPTLARFLFPGIALQEHGATLIALMRILLLSPLIFSCSGLLGSVTQVYNRFYITSISPILYNLGIIIGILFLYPFFGIKGIALGVLLGALMHLGIQIPFVLKQGLLPRFTLNILWNDVRRISFLSLYRALSLGASQIMLTFLTGFATTLAAGSVAVMTFAQNIQNIPLSLIGASYSVATFPVLSRFYAQGDVTAFINRLRDAARHIIFWSMPALVLFIVLRAQIVRVILGTGNFSWSDTRLTAACLALFAVSLFAQNLSLLFMRGYYAAGRNKESFFVTIIGAIVTISSVYGGTFLFAHSTAFRAFLEHLLRIENVSGAEIIMLPIAFSIGAMVNALCLLYLFKRDFRASEFPLFSSLFHSFAASVVMGFVAYQFLVYFGSLFNINTFIGILSQGFFAGVLGIVAGAVLLYMLKNQEFVETLTALRKHFRREEIVGVQEI